jgi:hypothetical protein
MPIAPTATPIRGSGRPAVIRGRLADRRVAVGGRPAGDEVKLAVNAQFMNFVVQVAHVHFRLAFR